MTRLRRNLRLPPNCSGLACEQASRKPNSQPGWAPANPQSPGLKMGTRFQAPRLFCAMPKQPAADSTCDYRRPDASRPPPSHDPAEIEPLDDVVAFQFVDRCGRDDDLAMDDDVAAIGDPDRLVEVLLRHQHGEADALVQFADLGD